MSASAAGRPSPIVDWRGFKLFHSLMLTEAHPRTSTRSARYSSSDPSSPAWRQWRRKGDPVAWAGG